MGDEKKAKKKMRSKTDRNDRWMNSEGEAFMDKKECEEEGKRWGLDRGRSISVIGIVVLMLKRGDD